MEGSISSINFASLRISSRPIGKEDSYFGPLLTRLDRRERELTSWEVVPLLMDLKFILHKHGKHLVGVLVQFKNVH